MVKRSRRVGLVPRLHREPLGLEATATALLRALPDEVRARRLVALVGAWSEGEALVAWDPALLAADPLDLDEPDGTTEAGGWWIGAWGYQLGGRLEEVGSPPPRPVPQPHHRIGLYDVILRRVSGEWWLEQQVGTDPTRDVDRRRPVLDVVRSLVPRAAGHGSAYRTGTFDLTPSPAVHRERVQRCREHILAGDLFQANLTARLEASFTGSSLAAFCDGVDTLAPAYAAYLTSPEGDLVSLSPELFLRREGRHVVTSPVKGTLPLDRDPALLTGSAKDRAENVMIVDVVRHDLGRVATPGGVTVPRLVALERHAVWHLVSDVGATLREEVTDGDLLRATFPPASVTGAPKIRAAQLLQELETTAREAYTGAVGVLGPGGLELNVAIRTFEVAAGRIWLGVGGGITASSDPDEEYAECLAKAAPLLRALGAELAPGLAPGPSADARTSVVATTERRDRLFDTLLVQDGQAVDPVPHLRRLRASVAAVLAEDLDVDDLALRVARAAAETTGAQRLRVDVGPGSRPGARPRVELTVRELVPDPPTLDLVPLEVPGGLGRHKWAERDVLRALPPGLDHLVLDTTGEVLETGRYALLAVVDDEVTAPWLDGRLLPGTGRARVAHALETLGAPLMPRRLLLEDLARAGEVLAVNALRGVVPVRSVEGLRSWSPGPVAGALRDLVAPGRPPAAPLPGPVPPRRVLVVDNYDSFTFNLVQGLWAAGHEATVVRNDEHGPDDLLDLLARERTTHVVLSPGPGRPEDAGVCVELVRRLDGRLPVLGVCLGHQVIATAYGGWVGRAPVPMHGRPALVLHDGLGAHAGLPSPLAVGRYHSLAVEENDLPPDLVVTSRSAGGTVMALRHRTHPVEGVQWHPESVLSPDGDRLLAAFLRSGR